MAVTGKKERENQMDNSYFETLAVPLPEDIEKLKWRGEFDRAARIIDNRLKRDIPLVLKKRLMIEREILKRMPEQYPYTWSEALAMLRDNVRDFEDSELETLWEEDAADWIYVDGEVRFRSSFLRNVLKTRKEYENRALDRELVRSKAENFALLNRTIAAMKEQGGAGCRFRIRGTLAIREEAERAGEEIKVYLPLPIEYAQIKNVNVHSVRIGGREAENWEYTIARADAFQRTICFHTKHRKGQEYSVEFSFENQETYLDFSCESLKHGGPEPGSERGAESCRKNGSAETPEAWLVQQQPHIRFTPFIREMAAGIAGEEQDPLRKARRIYDYITTHVMYSYVRSYFTLTDIPQYAASSMKGDCGVQALLFITLCRAVGIPARWQAGLYTSPFEISCHDWAQFYTESHGWRYADCSFGGAAYREGETQRWDFYFGNLDPFRLPAAREFGHEFEPPMVHLRNDPYDNQMGEAEYGDRSLLEEEYNTKYEMIFQENLPY